ncbi:MAG: hypothetical protein ACKPKF_18200 [Microcystis panniformis]
MTSRTGKQNPLQSPPESARVLSLSDRFLNLYFWHFFGEKSAKTTSHPALYEWLSFLEANGEVETTQQRRWNGCYKADG